MTGSDAELMDRAREASGLSDFGADEDFRVGLRVLIAAADDAGIDGDLRVALEAGWVAGLTTRLRLVESRTQQPDIGEQRIEGPLAVIGLPRTGTTALVDVLAQDPAARAPMQWETANLFPPASRDAWDRDPRIAAMQDAFDAAADTNPIVALGLHTFGAMLPDECNSMLTAEFWSPNLTAAYPMPLYSAWLRHARPARPYRTHHWLLQHLQAHGPAGRWTLKSPFHAFAVRAFVDEYPDAMLVQTHRDPAELMPSMCGLYATIRGFGPGHPGRIDTGKELLELWGTGMQRCLADRSDPVLGARVFDVSHRAMTADPMGTVRSIYEHFDLPLTADAASAMEHWIAHPVQHRSSVRFTLEDFGLDRDQVEAAFGDYRSRLGRYF
jgi:hypothetical protein